MGKGVEYGGGGGPSAAPTSAEQQRWTHVPPRGSLPARRRGHDRQGPTRSEAMGMVARLGASAAMGGRTSAPARLDCGMERGLSQQG